MEQNDFMVRYQLGRTGKGRFKIILYLFYKDIINKEAFCYIKTF